MKKCLLILLIIIYISSFSSKAQISIADAHLASIGSSVTVKGIVTNGSELGAIRYIQDTSGGMAIYGSSLSSVNRGDSITVTGTLSNYNNLLEMTPIGSLSINSTGNPLPAFQLVNPSEFDETLESELVRIDHVIFAGAGGTFAGNTNYNFSSAGFNGQVRITTGTNIVGTPIPVGEITLKGILSQFCSSPGSGCTTGYQLLPRDLNDIVILPGIHIISAVTQSSINTTSFNLSWTTDSTGTSAVRYGNTPLLELGVVSGAGGSSTHSVSLSGLSPAHIYYAQAYSIHGSDTAFSGIAAYATRSLSSGDIKVYFNTPVNNSVSSGTNAVALINTIDDTLINYINRAKYSLDLTIYDFDNSGISNISTAINNAYSRGVKVRFISDGNNVATNFGVTDLSPSIPQLLSPTGGPYNIMHNKFVIIDANSANPMEPIVWTGATNWTNTQINNDPNNVIIFQDQSLARAYTIEFEEMWGDTGSVPNMLNSRFGPDKTDNTPHEFLINGKRVECYFSPSDGVNAKILSTINSANTEINFASMVITRFDLATALAAKAGTSVDVFGIVDDHVATTQWSVLLTGMGPERLQDYTPSNIMHNKYVIVDQADASSDPILLTGSHNWSSSAETRNDENTVIVHDQSIANIYYQAFYDLFTGNGGIGLAVFDQNANSEKVIVYPNPSSDLLHISGITKINKAVIYDLMGSVVKEQAIHQEGILDISVNELVPGMYTLQLITDTKTYNVRWIKN